MDFFALWCGPCKIMHPILEELKKKIGDNAHILKVDIDSPANRNLVSQYQVHSVPTLIIFRNGQPVWRQSGVRPVEELEKALQL